MPIVKALHYLRTPQTRVSIQTWIGEAFPGHFTEGSFQGFMTQSTVNGSPHNLPRFIYNDAGRYSFYRSMSHGRFDQTEEVASSFLQGLQLPRLPSQFSGDCDLFRDEIQLCDYVVANPSVLGRKLKTLIGTKTSREYRFPSGRRADIVAVDGQNMPVIIEAKLGLATAKALKQLLSYRDEFSEANARKMVKLVVIAAAFTPELKQLASHLPQLQLWKYRYRSGAPNFAQEGLSAAI